jgi:hypothetical protein
VLRALRSNAENWTLIESRVMYLVQLWYDAFMLEEGRYPFLIANYKLLRKEGAIFPPRDPNEKALIAVRTESPIFDNIEAIARNCASTQTPTNSASPKG